MFIVNFDTPSTGKCIVTNSLKYNCQALQTRNHTVLIQAKSYSIQIIPIDFTYSMLVSYEIEWTIINAVFLS